MVDTIENLLRLDCVVDCAFDLERLDGPSKLRGGIIDDFLITLIIENGFQNLSDPVGFTLVLQSLELFFDAVQYTDRSTMSSARGGCGLGKPTSSAALSGSGMKALCLAPPEAILPPP